MLIIARSSWFQCREKFANYLSLFLLLFCAPLAASQARLTSREIARAQSLGRRTKYPLKLGTLIHTRNGDWIAFITTPEGRVAYAESDKNDEHGSGGPDPLANDLDLNRLRVTGLPFPSTGPEQHNSRKAWVCDHTGDHCIRPAREVLDVNQVVAEFDMPSVLAVSGPSGTFLLRIENDAGKQEPETLVPIASLKQKSKS